MKRVVCLLFVAAAVSGVLFAGGGQAAGSGKTISYYYWNPDQAPGQDPTIEAYTRASGVKVETTIIPFPQWQTKMQTALPSNAGPDVFWVNTSGTSEFIPAGLLLPLDDLIKRDNVDITKFPSVLIQNFSYNGKLFCIPKDFDTIGLWYNKAHFDEAGLPYPTENWTWADLRSAAEKLTDRGRNRYGFAVTAGTQNFINPWITNNGVYPMLPDRSMVNYNQPGVIEALKEAIRYIDDGLSPSGQSQLEMDAPTRFQAGSLSMITDGNWQAPTYTAALGDKVGVTAYPYNKKRGNIINGLGFGISANSPNKEEAWGLVRAFASKEGQEAQAKVVIPGYAGAETAFLANYPNLDLRLFIEAAQYADRMVSAGVARSAQGNAVSSNIANIIMKTVSVEEGVAAIDREAKAAYDAAPK